MTVDEFERILAAMAEMRALGVNGESWIPFNGVLRILHANLHPEDKGRYVWNDQLRKWQRCDDAPGN